jgi:4-amino-4-deoxy-L-arabinose transferase-like glycosyltransferase
MRRDIPLTPLTRRLLVAALLLLFTAQLVHVAHVYSANWDEAHHLYDGYNIWTQHDYRLNAEVPPLVKLTAALPLLHLHHLTVPPPTETNAFVAGRLFVFSNGGDRLLFPARMACMLFTLLLAGILYAATRNLFGTLAGFLAFTLFLFDPLVLAHGTLVSTDIASACFLFASVYAFYRYGLAPAPARLALAGLVTGLALVSKFTGILIVPMLLALAIAEAILARSLTVLGKRLAACAAIFFIAWIVLWSFYGFRYAPAPHGLQLSPALPAYLQSMPNPHNAAELSFLARIHLFPEPYLWGLANTRITEAEYTSFFFGHVYRHGPWQYFPAAFLIKSTLPLLILLLLLPFLWFRAPHRHARELSFLLIPPCIYFAVVTASHFDIGARHLMPIYPFLYALAAAGAANAFHRSRPWAIVASLLIAWQIITSVRVSPSYMAYGNEAWGGPLQVHRYLSDANVDWGQQLKAVKLYLDHNHITHCWFVYFPDGAVQPSDYGIHCHRLPTANILSWIKLPMDVPPTIDGTVLISDSDLAGIEFGDGPLNPYESFHSIKPAATIQDGIYVYRGHFAIPLAAALIDDRNAAELATAGHLDAAQAMALQALSLAPNSAIVQLNYADRLAALHQWPEALQHYQLANTLARTIRPDLQDDLLPAITAGLTSAQSHLQPQPAR